MSIQNVKKFYEELAKSKELQEKSMELSKKYSDQEPDEAVATSEIVSMAKSVGFDFTADDLKAFSDEQKKQKLSDDELEAVSGGYVGEAEGWELCFCAVGGGGTKKSEGITCMCVLVGFGYLDSNKYSLDCIGVGYVVNQRGEQVQ